MRNLNPCSNAWRDVEEQISALPTHLVVMIILYHWHDVIQLISSSSFMLLRHLSSSFVFIHSEFFGRGHVLSSTFIQSSFRQARQGAEDLGHTPMPYTLFNSMDLVEREYHNSKGCLTDFWACQRNRCCVTIKLPEMLFHSGPSRPKSSPLAAIHVQWLE